MSEDLNGIINQLNSDISDLLNLTDAKRCHQCKHYYLPGYICSCGKDNSEYDDEDDEY